MSRSDILRKADAAKVKDTDKDCLNKWCWSWLERKVDDILLDSWCGKLAEAGKAYCSVCRVEIRYDSGGCRALTDHARSKKHQAKIATAKKNFSLPAAFGGSSHASSDQPRPKPTCSASETEKPQLPSVPLCDRVCNMEATILGFVAEKNLPFNVTPALVELCKETSRDPKALNEVALGETAAKYKLVYGVSKTMKSKIISDLQQFPFALNIDEATSKNDRKVLCILVSYFSPELGQVVVRHFESLSLVRVTSEALFKEIANLMESNNIPWTNLIAVLMDSCNVMRGSKTGLETRLREKAPHLLDTDGDTCHHAHNAAKVFCKPFGGLAESLFADLYSDCKWSPDLKEMFHEICLMLGIKMSTPKRYVSHRWLSAYDVAVDTTRLFPALVLLYYGFLPEHEQNEFKAIFNTVCDDHHLSEEARQQVSSFRGALKKKKLTKEGFDRKRRICEKLFHLNLNLKLVLSLYVAVLPMLKAYTVYFEKKKPLIHKLLDEQEKLVREFLACFVAPEVINDSSLKKLCSLDLKKHVMSNSNLFLGKAQQLISSAPRKSHTVATFLDQTKAAYLACAQCLLKKMPLHNPFLKSAQALDPVCKGTAAVIKPLEKLGELLSCILTDEEGQAFTREVRAYNVDNSLQFKEEELDEWWAKVQKTGRYPCLSKVALAAASCFHGPQVEAAFSSMGDVMDEKSASMQVETYSCIQTSKYFLRSHMKTSVEYFRRDDLVHTPVDKVLCRNIQSARKAYQEFCDKKHGDLEKKERVLACPSQQAATSKKKFASMMDFVNQRARQVHTQCQGK